MNQFLARIPKAILAFSAIAIGTALIILKDPPRTVCDAQKDIFIKQMTPLLLPDPKSTKAQSQFELLVEQCKYTNGPGGCYELFMQFREMLSSLSGVSNECQRQVGNLSLVRKSLWEAIDLLVRLAWGQTPPKGYYQRLGWLDYADMNLFCQLKQKVQYLYGKAAWQSFQEKMFRDLPGAKNRPRDKVWGSMILSVNCSSYQ